MPNLKITLPAPSVMLKTLLSMFSKRTLNSSSPGLSAPSVSTPTIQSSEIKPGNALVLSENPVKLTETNVHNELKEINMSLNSVVVSLSTIVSGISAIASGVVAVYENGQKLLDILKAAVVKVEDQFSSLKAAGATKKEIVMSTLQAAADALGEAWDSIKAYFSTLIDSIIAVYNQAKSVVSDVKTVADGGTVTADTSATASA